MMLDGTTNTTPSDSKLPGPVLDVVLDLWAQGGCIHVIPVQGNSMRPFLREGDRVKVLHGQEGLHRGDIVAYQLNRTLIIHRLLKKVDVDGELHYLLKGDNAAAVDPVVPGSKIIGRAVALQRTYKWSRLDTLFIRTVGWFIAMKILACKAIFRRIKRVIN